MHTLKAFSFRGSSIYRPIRARPELSSAFQTFHGRPSVGLLLLQGGGGLRPWSPTKVSAPGSHSGTAPSPVTDSRSPYYSLSRPWKLPADSSTVINVAIFMRKENLPIADVFFLRKYPMGSGCLILNKDWLIDWLNRKEIAVTGFINDENECFDSCFCKPVNVYWILRIIYNRNCANGYWTEGQCSFQNQPQ